MEKSPASISLSSIKDNHNRGSVGEFLIESIKPQSDLSIVSAYFTIYAYYQLKKQLDDINHLRFLFGEPTFIKAIDPAKTNKRDFKIEDDKLVIPLESRMTQKAIAGECAKWIDQKVEIRSMVKPSFLHGKMYHITQQSGIEKAVVGSSNFTVNGLGLGGSTNIELNLVVDNDRDRSDLKAWFNELWEDDIVSDSLYLLGILNSRICHYLVLKNAAGRQGGFVEFKPMYISPLPIPDPPENENISKMVSQILSMTKDNPHSNILSLEATLDASVAHLYLLTAEEYDLILSDLKLSENFRTACRTAYRKIEHDLHD